MTLCWCIVMCPCCTPDPPKRWAVPLTQLETSMRAFGHGIYASGVHECIIVRKGPGANGLGSLACRLCTFNACAHPELMPSQVRIATPAHGTFKQALRPAVQTKLTGCSLH